MHGSEHIVKELYTFGSNHHTHYRVFFAGGQGLARRVWPIVEFFGHFDNQPLFFRLDVATFVQDSVYCAAGYSAEFRDLFYRNHCLTFLCHFSYP